MTSCVGRIESQLYPCTREIENNKMKTAINTRLPTFVTRHYKLSTKYGTYSVTQPCFVCNTPVSWCKKTRRQATR